MAKEDTSNLEVDSKNLIIKANYPVAVIEKREKITNGGPYRHPPRTLQTVIEAIYEHFSRSEKMRQTQLALA